MNLDELVLKLKSIEGETSNDIAQMLVEWKDNDKTLNELHILALEKLKSSPLEKRKLLGIQIPVQAFFHRMSSELPGMTMNERLFWTGLFDRFDRSESDRSIVYKKLHGSA